MDEPNMSDTNLLLTVEDLINISMGPITENKVNFKVLQTVLHILARQLRMLEVKVEIRPETITSKRKRKGKKKGGASPRAKQGKGKPGGTKKKDTTRDQESPTADNVSEGERRDREKSVRDKEYIIKDKDKDKESPKKKKVLKKGKKGVEAHTSHESNEDGEVTRLGDDSDEGEGRYGHVERGAAGSVRRRRKSKRSAPGSDISISEIERDNEKILVVEKGRGRESVLDRPVRIGSVEVVSRSDFEALEDSVRDLQSLAGPIPHPTMPDNQKLRDDIAAGNVTLTDAMQNMQLGARVDAAEQGLVRLISMLTSLASSGVLPQNLAEKANILLRQSIGRIASLSPQRAGLTQGTPKSPRSQVGTPRSYGGTQSEHTPLDSNIRGVKFGKGSGAAGVDHRARSVEHGAGGIDQRARSVDHGAAGVGQRARSVDYGTGGVDHRARSVDYGGGGIDHETRGVDYGAGGIDHEARGVDYGRGGVDYGHGGVDYGRGGVDYGRGGVDYGARGVNYGADGYDYGIVGGFDPEFDDFGRSYEKDKDGFGFDAIMGKKDCITKPELDDALRRLRKELMAITEAVNAKLEESNDIANKNARALAEKNEQNKYLENQLAMMSALVRDYSEQLNGLEEAFLTQITCFEDQMSQVKADLAGGLKQMENVTGNTETPAVTELTERYEMLVQRLDAAYATNDALQTYQTSLELQLTKLMETIQILQEGKNDRDELIDGLRDKADLSRLEGLLREEVFLLVKEDLQLQINLFHDKFHDLDAVWQEALQNLSDENKQKAELFQLESTKEQLENYLKELEAKINELAVVVGEPEAAILTRKLAKDSLCGVCMVPAHMWPFARIPEGPPGAPAVRAPPAGAEGDHCWIAAQDPRSHICNRWCGGSHTLLRATRTGPTHHQHHHHPPVSGYGDDGRMYMLEAEPQACAECNNPAPSITGPEDNPTLDK